MAFKKVIILFVLTLSLPVFGQKVRSLRMNNNYEKYRDSRNFDYVHEDFDSTKLTWVADIRVEFDTIIPGIIGEAFKRVKERANKNGASGFRIIDSDIFKLGRGKYIDVAVYWVRMEDRGDLMALHQTNKVYLFGFLGHHREIQGYNVKIQDEEFIMKALTYREYEFPVKTKVAVQLGSKARGAKVHCIMEERMYPKFYYFNVVKGSFKNSWIDEYGLAYGHFLTQILRKD